ncbi:photosystem I protein PsaX [Microcoleus sp. FACHB-1515]|nr:photosystem I protein PsaX [Microcoleus sp. FACHB-1515]MBD2091655.1 photosystem I protein PsaX [Microcoleus sp. FACHB-1515]
MTAKSAPGSEPPVIGGRKPPYPYRTFWALLLLAGNFLIAAFYFGILH